jgi:pSer/pThr/pTyr-binding forkhead associated (FHA) protein
VRPEGVGAVVEDLGSSNGTFVNHSELHAPAVFEPGDELLTGGTVIALRSEQDVASQPSAVRPVPPALATEPRPPSYVAPREAASAPAGSDDLNALRDIYVKTRAKTAPLAIFVLVALVVVIYLGTR